MIDRNDVLFFHAANMMKKYQDTKDEPLAAKWVMVTAWINSYKQRGTTHA